MNIWQFFEIVYADLNSLEVTLGNSVFKLLMSMILGALVGAERKRKGQIAGVRTFALISMGSCMAMLLSIYVPQVYLGLKNGDPGRIAAQVITGVGFLGGGAMIHMKGSVKGLTTAAGIWMTAAIGMAVGVGMYFCSLFATVLILVTLVLFESFEHKRNMGQENRTMKLQVDHIVDDITPYREILNRHGIHLSTYFIQYDYVNNRTEINFVVLAPSHRDYLPLFDAMRGVNPTLSLTLTSEY
ncbi:MAG: MgtC/SapB family protein [Bacteroidales bacterium]|nr:MgtC/SapB family protein [Bacteroidales bacterium]